MRAERDNPVEVRSKGWFLGWWADREGG